MAFTEFLFSYFIVAFVAAQFVPAPTDLTAVTGPSNITIRYKQVPAGICEQNPDVKSYAGYADVAPDQHIFFWFFEARTIDPSKAPLSVWLGDGRGTSVEPAIFESNGPCRIDVNNKVVNNPYSWSNVSNMLYIDYFTQAGFSYSILVPAYVGNNSRYPVPLSSNSCPDPDISTCGTFSYPNNSLTAGGPLEAAQTFWTTIEGFMGAFPQYARSKINLAGQNYGGRDAPVFVDVLKDMSEASPVSVDTVLIGNAWVDRIAYYVGYYNFSVSPGNTYDYILFNESVAAAMYDTLWGTGNCIRQANDCKRTNKDEICVNATDSCFPVDDLPFNRSLADIREPFPDPFPPPYFVDYLNTPQVQSAIGAYQNYTEWSNFVGDEYGYLNDAIILEDIKGMISQDINVVLYYGDAEILNNWMGGEFLADELDPPGFTDAGYANISTSDNVVRGQVKQSGTFSFVRVYEAGRAVPFYQPELALTMFSRAIERKDIATGQVDVDKSYKSTGPAKSLFREGNSTVQFTEPGPNAVYNTTDGSVSQGTNNGARGALGRRLASDCRLVVGDQFVGGVRRNNLT